MHKVIWASPLDGEWVVFQGSLEECIEFVEKSGRNGNEDEYSIW